MTQRKTETLIVKQNGNELIKSDLKFRVIMGTVSKRRYDCFTYDSYSEAKARKEKLKQIFKAFTYDIIIIEA